MRVDFSAFNLFRYQTFRSGAACLTSLVICFWLGPRVIRWLKSVQRGGQPIRDDGPERHLIEKKGTPTMGGVLILAAMTTSTLLWGRPAQRLRVGRAFLHDRLWRGGFRRRLPEAFATQYQGRIRARQTGRAIISRHPDICLDRAPHRRRAGDQPGRSRVQRRAAATRVRLSAIRDARARRQQQRGKPDGRTRWPCNRTHHNRGGRVRAYSPISLATAISPITCN